MQIAATLLSLVSLVIFKNNKSLPYLQDQYIRDPLRVRVPTYYSTQS